MGSTRKEYSGLALLFFSGQDYKCMFHTPNSCYIDEAVILETVLGLEGQKPGGPATLDALLTLIEACIVHEHVWFDVRAAWGDTAFAEVRESRLIAELVSANVLKPFPEKRVVDEALAGTDYDLLEVLSDAFWTGHSMVAAQAQGEAWLYKVEAMLVSSRPTVFQQRRLTDDDDGPLGSDAAYLAQLGFPKTELIMLESFNRRAQALMKLSKNLALHLCTVPLVVPHQGGAIALSNGIARRAYERLDTAAREAFETEFDNSQTPLHSCSLLASTALRDLKGDPKALADVILRARKSLTALRNYMSEFEVRWSHAATRIERRSLEAELSNATAKLASKAGRPSDRVIYRLWDVVKSPTKILQSLGDVFIRRGREEALVGQVRGLRAFWSAAERAPADDVLLTVYKKTVPNFADQAVWDAAERFNSALSKNFEARVLQTTR